MLFVRKHFICACVLLLLLVIFCFSQVRICLLLFKQNSLFTNEFYFLMNYLICYHESFLDVCDI